MTLEPDRDENSMAESAERTFRQLKLGGTTKVIEGLPAGVQQVLRLLASSNGGEATGRTDHHTAQGTNADTGSSAAITIDRFRLIRPIGQGGFGVVYLARDTLLDRVVALKLPKPHVLFNDDLRSRFLREARAASNLHHANIAQVYDASQVSEASFIACEYCDGGSLEDWLHRKTAPLDARTTARLVVQLADAVHHAHSEGILHRDLKPSNILLKSTPNSRTGEMPYVVKVADFGLAKLQSFTGEATLSGIIVGSIRYMSPEQAMARPQAIDARSDVYSLGVVMYQLLTGRVPFDSDSHMELLRDVVERPPRHVQQLGEKLRATFRRSV